MLFLLLIFLDPTGSALVQADNGTFTTDALTYKEGPIWKVVVEEEAEVYLPEGAMYVGGENISGVDVDGKRLVVRFEGPGYAEYQLEEKEHLPYLPLVAILLGGGAAYYYLFLRKGGKEGEGKAQQVEGREQGGAGQKKVKGPEGLLPEREAKALRAISRYPGICFKDLLNLLGWPKSTLSITLKRLEAKGLIKSAKKGLSKCYYPEVNL